ARLRPQLLAAAAARQEAERQEGAESGEPVEAAAAADVAEADEEEVEVSAESSAPAAGGPALVKLENWLGLSAQPDHEYLYRISAAGGGNARQWVVDVRRVDSQGKGPVHVKRALTAGSRLAPVDEQIFQGLMGHETRYDSKIVLADEDLADLLELMRSRKV